MQTQEQSLSHYKFSHLGLILGCAVLLIASTYLKGGFSFHQASQATASDQKILTYEEVKAQVEAENKPRLDQAIAALGSQGQDQIALLDPSSGGKVLGANTDDMSDILGNPDEIFNKEILDKIKIETLVATNSESLKAYAEKVKIVENSFGSLEILSNLNTDDKKILADNSAKAKVLIAALSKVPVPEELVEYQKYKMLYYLSISHLSEIMAGSRSDAEVDNTTQIFFGAMQKIQNIQQSLNQKYNLSF